MGPATRRGSTNPTPIFQWASFRDRILLISDLLVGDTTTEFSYTRDVAAKKGQHGGPRPGSGRKPILSDPKAIKVSLDGSTYDRLAEAAEERETSIGALVREAIEAYLPRQRRRGRK